MQIFVFKDYTAETPCHTIAVIVAEDAKQARKLLNKQLRDNGHQPAKLDAFEPLDVTRDWAWVLSYGDMP